MVFGDFKQNFELSPTVNKAIISKFIIHQYNLENIISLNLSIGMVNFNFIRYLSLNFVEKII